MGGGGQVGPKFWENPCSAGAYTWALQMEKSISPLFPGPEGAVVANDWCIKKKRKCTIRVAKTKALISFMVTAKLICIFVFVYADCWFSHEAAQIKTTRP